MENFFYEALKDNNQTLFVRKSSYVSRLHFHRAYEILYFNKGNAKVTVGNNVYDVETDDIIFVNEYEPHKVCGDCYFENFVLGLPIDMSVDVRLVFNGKTLPAALLNKEFNRKLKPIFQSLFETSKQSNKLFQKGMINVLCGLLISEYELIEYKQINKKLSTFVEVLNYIDENYAEDIALKDVADKFGYNQTYFSRLFNSRVKYSFNTYLNNIRYFKFKEKLSENGGDVTKTIFDVGFTSLSVFYRTKARMEETL